MKVAHMTEGINCASAVRLNLVSIDSQAMQAFHLHDHPREHAVRVQEASAPLMPEQSAEYKARDDQVDDTQ